MLSASFSHVAIIWNLLINGCHEFVMLALCRKIFDMWYCKEQIRYLNIRLVVEPDCECFILHFEEFWSGSFESIIYFSSNWCQYIVIYVVELALGLSRIRKYLKCYELVAYGWTMRLKKINKKEGRWDSFLEFAQGFRNTGDSMKNRHKTMDVYRITFILIWYQKKRGRKKHIPCCLTSLIWQEQVF